MGINAQLNTRLNLIIPKELKAKLEILAKKQNRSTTNLIIILLKDYVDTQK